MLLFGVKGKNVRMLKPGRTQVNVIKSHKREHSRKPDKQYKIIEGCSWSPYFELFARGKRNNWTVWGNECKFYNINWKTYKNNSSVK